MLSCHINGLEEKMPAAGVFLRQRASFFMSTKSIG